MPPIAPEAPDLSPDEQIENPFAGSGASRTAGENLKLDLVWKGADIDPAYCG